MPFVTLLLMYGVVEGGYSKLHNSLLACLIMVALGGLSFLPLVKIYQYSAPSKDWVEACMISGFLNGVVWACWFVFIAFSISWEGSGLIWVAGFIGLIAWLCCLLAKRFKYPPWLAWVEKIASSVLLFSTPFLAISLCIMVGVSLANYNHTILALLSAPVCASPLLG